MNTITLNEADNIIRQVYMGDQSDESLGKMVVLTNEYAQKLRSQGKKVLIIAVIRDLGNLDSGAKQAAIKGMRQVDFDKIALLGTSSLIKFILEELLATISGDRTALFNKEEEAIAWLQN